MPIPDASPPLSAEQPLGGRYRLHHQLAQGGMATVWEGYDEILARPVAIKVLHPHLAADRLFLERFRREAISAARLSHPNVVATFDAGMAGDATAYIVMELIKGPTLRELLAEKGPMSPRLVLSLGRQITDALAHAHNAGLIHRDIKPANVLACSAGTDGLPRVKVTDFGIAKAAEGLGLDLTKTGTIVGTPRYLSPEQIEGREPDARADLYALGVLMYEMLTGLPPFSGPTDVVTALQHLNSPAPHVRDRAPDVSPALDGLVYSLMAKRPEDRPPSAAAVHQTLASLEAAEAVTGVMAGSVVRSTDRQAIDRPRFAPPTGPPVATPAGPAFPPPVGPPGLSVGPDVGPAIDPRLVRSDRGWADGSGAPGGDHTPTSPGTPVPGSVRTRRRPPNWPGRIVAALVALAVLVVVLIVIGSGRGGRNPSGTTSGQTPASGAVIPIADGSVFHLERDADHADQVKLAFDANPQTMWTTDQYLGPRFAGLRHGLGLALRLNERHRLHQLIVTSPTQGWSAEVYVADEIPSPPSLTAWGQPVASQQEINGSTTFSLGGKEGTVILLWLTDLGPSDKASIAELAVH